MLSIAFMTARAAQQTSLRSQYGALPPKKRKSATRSRNVEPLRQPAFPRVAHFLEAHALLRRELRIDTRLRSVEYLIGLPQIARAQAAQLVHGRFHDRLQFFLLGRRQMQPSLPTIHRQLIPLRRIALPA